MVAVNRSLFIPARNEPSSEAGPAEELQGWTANIRLTSHRKIGNGIYDRIETKCSGICGYPVGIGGYLSPSISPVWIRAFRCGKREDEFCACSFRADDIDILVMRADDFADDGKAKSGSFFISATGDVRLIKTLPDLWQVLLRDAFPEVFDGDEDKLFPLVGADQDFFSGWAEFDCVVNKVVEYLLDTPHICADDQRLIRESCVDRQIFLLAEHLERIEGVTDHLGDIKFGKIQVNALVVEAV